MANDPPWAYALSAASDAVESAADTSAVSEGTSVGAGILLTVRGGTDGKWGSNF